nr:MAG TPA: hypothetical protein [Caudoviricetes sp.]DAX59121.1 MAG TPA: hypothetical protein [Caudoviricetes sp.]
MPRSFICILKILFLYLYKEKEIINPKIIKVWKRKQLRT